MRNFMFIGTTNRNADLFNFIVRASTEDEAVKIAREYWTPRVNMVIAPKREIRNSELANYTVIN
jgi:hypothetical protein